MAIITTAAAILKSRDGRFLMQLRDNSPGISYPNKWALFGGVVEDGETPVDCLVRELKEEIGLECRNPIPWKQWPWRNYVLNLFEVSLDKDLSELSLNEGADMRLFSKGELLHTDMAFCLNDVFKEYLEGNDPDWN